MEGIDRKNYPELVLNETTQADRFMGLSPGAASRFYLFSETPVFYNKTPQDTKNAGFDIFMPKNITVPANAKSFKIPLGIRSRLVDDTAGFISYMLLPRSSTGLKTPLRMCNSIGIIDCGYTGEICAVVDNVSDEPFKIICGQRLFQLVKPDLGPFPPVVMFDDLAGFEKTVLPVSQDLRKDGGFGSTGV